MTNLGRAKEAAALANGTAIVITHIAIGDGATVPSGGETSLYNEVARKAISGHGTVVGAANTAYFDIFLAAADGPYTIREAGLYDSAGDLIAIARYDPPISKPVPSSGQTVEGTVRLQVAFSNIANVTIVVDPAFTVPLQRLSRLPWIPVLSMSVTAPPATPAIGDAYLVPTGATGSWAGQSGKVTEYTTAGWAILTSPDGHGISLPDGRIFEKVGGTYIEKPALDVQSGKWGYVVAGGTANALIATLTPAPSAYAVGMVFAVKINANNTGPATIDFNGLGVKPIVRVDGSALEKDDLTEGQIATLMYDGSAWQVDGLKSSQMPPRTMTSYSVAGSYSFIVPAGIYKVYGICVGGGGGGAGMGVLSNGTAAPGGGGGAGGYSEGWIDVVPAQAIPITVGAGGAGGAASAGTSGSYGVNGSSGGTSSIGSFLSATGADGGGAAAANGGGGGGAGGRGVGGQLVGYGGSGTDGGGPRTPTIGGSGGSSRFGGGGRAGTTFGGAQNGLAQGSGGGAVYSSFQSQALGKGGDGAPGSVIIQY